MQGKRTVVVLLAIFNVALLVGLLTSGLSLSPAYGQGAGRGGNFVCVTAKPSGQTYDVLYVADVTGRKLYAFYPTGASDRRLTVAPPRDLAKDFGRP